MLQVSRREWGSGEAHLRRAHLLFSVIFSHGNSCVIIDVRPERDVSVLDQAKGKGEFSSLIGGVCLDFRRRCVYVVQKRRKEGDDDDITT